jgi:hypothetical protein
MGFRLWNGWQPIVFKKKASSLFPPRREDECTDC